jgi:hypothetical protein
MARITRLTALLPPNARIALLAVVIVAPLVALLTLGLKLSGYHSVRARNASPMLKVQNAQSLAQYNIFIVDQSDPSFDGLFTALVKVPPDLAPDVKQFSVFITNNSDRAVAAYLVRWEFVQADGRIVPSSQAYARLRSLDGSAQSEPPALAAHSSRLVSQINEIETRTAPATYIGDHNLPADKQATIKSGTTQSLSALQNQLKTSASWSASLDSILFTDGTFAGPDTSGYFDRLKAQFDGRADFLQELSAILANPSANQAQAYADIFSRAKNVPNAEHPRLAGLAATDYYNRSRAFLAREIITRQANQGDQQTIDYIKSESSRPRIQLVKR